MRTRRMDEGDQGALRSRPRLFIDQSNPARLQLRESRGDIVDTERDVMNARSALLEIAGDWRIRSGGLEQFELGAGIRARLRRRLTNGQEVGTDPLRADIFGGLDLETERVPIKGQRGVQVLNRNANVIEDGLHGW